MAQAEDTTNSWLLLSPLNLLAWPQWSQASEKTIEKIPLTGLPSGLKSAHEQRLINIFPKPMSLKYWAISCSPYQMLIIDTQILPDRDALQDAQGWFTQYFFRWEIFEWNSSYHRNFNCFDNRNFNYLDNRNFNSFDKNFISIEWHLNKVGLGLLY